MGIFSFFRKKDINAGVEKFRSTKNAVLIDVRTADEYKSGHIEGSINIPLDEISSAPDIIKDFSAPVFVHCLSGHRSTMAAKKLSALGYENISDIGGISSYKGKIINKGV